MDTDGTVHPERGPSPLRIVVDTHADLTASPEVLREWVKEMERLVVEPLHERLHSVLGLPPEWGDHDEHGDPQGHWLALIAEHTDEDIEVQPYTRRQFERLTGDLVSGDLVEYSIEGGERDQWGAAGGRGAFGVVVRFYGRRFPGAASQVGVRVTLEFLDPPLDETTQVYWVNLARWSFIHLKGSYGFVGNASGSRTPYEEEIGRSLADGLRECSTLARGYFWGNLLSSNHVHGLGGVNRIKKEAPCASAQELPLDGEVGVFLQLTPSIVEYSDGDLVRLKEYLRPILPRPPEHRPPTRTGSPPAHRRQLPGRNHPEALGGEAG